MPAFVVAPLVAHRARANRAVRRRPRVPRAAAADDDDSEFMLPASARDATSRAARPRTTVGDIRLMQKRTERQPAPPFNDEEDEARRVQLAGEQLSAADLFGTAAPPVSAPAAPPAPRRRAGSGTTADNTRYPDARASMPLAGADGHYLTPGAIVSHARHGFGRFRGLERTIETREETGLPRAVAQSSEFVVLEYRDGDVYVPLAHLDLISKVAAGAMPAKLDLLSARPNTQFSGVSNLRRRRAKHAARVKTRARIRQQLVNLNALYSTRLKLKRTPFPVNEEAEMLFNESCGFTLTPDQIRASAEVLDDLSVSWRPMDRLLCGDVGFGKTEVAMRAAFRVLSAGMQVAFLAPTTILAHQHYETIRARLARHFPDVEVACLTRFVKRKKLLEYRERLASGHISVAVGTHILLTNSINIKTLGLLICDEEHRWGVNQKERLRERYSGVDTLFLSATPIPRTLHLALSGIKDTSVLAKPPPGRKAVITRVVQSGAGVIRSAIEKEVKRKGQVFYVVPRIAGIEDTAQWLRELIPDLRVVVAHGSNSDLEQRVWSFAQSQYDVLVCTTVIENGINLPKVNTLIVQDAGQFGLAQLHQLRGRVGRCDVQAYAWLLFARSTVGAQSVAEKRMNTLEKHSQLGAGFVIAQKDMEMRGVGTVLGVEQHGNNSVNVDEYSQMLAEELAFARTGHPIPLSLPNTDRCEVFLPVAAFIPTEYISDTELKMFAYSSMSSAKTLEQLKSVANMLEAKFGSLPTSTRLHISLLEVKILAKSLGISKVYTERQHVVLDWSVSAETFEYLVDSIVEQRVRARFELTEEIEKVYVRGLGICQGDIQLAKMREYLMHFAAVAKGIQTREKPSSVVEGLGIESKA